MTRRLLLLLSLVVVAALAFVVLQDDPAPVAVDPAPTPTATSSPVPSPSPSPSRQPPQTELACRASGPFTPTSISVVGVTSGSPVLAMPRDANGVVGVPPLTTEGKQEFAWDEPGVAPGSPAGHVLLNAHTWPDGSALGNRLLDGLPSDGQLTVRGPSGRCLRYDVARRIEVPAETRMPEIYSPDGPPRLVIIVCSGVRRGPGDWSRRTLWFAEPV